MNKRILLRSIVLLLFFFLGCNYMKKENRKINSRDANHKNLDTRDTLECQLKDTAHFDFYRTKEEFVFFENKK